MKSVSSLRPLTLGLTLTLAGLVNAQTPTAAATAPVATTASSVMTAGEVRKVDKSANKITLRHEPIQNLDMPAMTMVFQAPQAALIDGLVRSATRCAFTPNSATAPTW